MSNIDYLAFKAAKHVILLGTERVIWTFPARSFNVYSTVVGELIFLFSVTIIVMICLWRPSPCVSHVCALEPNQRTPASLTRN